ncbi:MAG: sensor histidine kinase [Caldilineales bacterium]|nr:sensor histidine kinase [Caldilineales bacterium]
MANVIQSGDAQTESDRTERFWHRWRWLWSAVFLATVLVPLPMIWGSADITDAQRLQLIGLSLLMIVAHGLMVFVLERKHPEIRQFRRYTITYVAIITLLWIPMVRIDPAYFLTFGGLISQLFIWVEIPWSIPLAFVLMVLAFTVEGDFALGDINLGNSGLWLWLFLTGAAVMLALFINSIIGENMRRQELIRQLQETRSELAASERREGILAERQRLAHEIHDTLAQGFTSIVMHLEAAEQAIGQDDQIVQRHVDLARRTARISLDQARRVVQDLRPRALEQATLAEAIERTAGEWTEQSGIETQVTVTGAGRPLHPAIEVTLLRAVQEALSNVRKHAQATRVNITLSYMDDVVVLDVQDDGVGLQPNSTPGEGGYGLTAMRERVEQMHGSLLVESRPHEGTTLVIEIPIQPASEQEVQA